eukprot:CAMPEP_0113973378 /NCGR_PEP_ID=MMETSP0011_2-20120614/14401_1 /TAXON_ID=101924 /ORGANISM="Rhodosorus marinus" /LENGTH=351 /DNA_ID=CAMNT_0000991263 /DNA_START=262 /DNA_END=1318 /DNA_ORIENTATION=- /assembly_acc=CAM_ASM_000156
MGADWIPLDISSGLTKELPEDVKYRWGICGTGRCCHDFVQALKGLPNAVLACVSSRSTEKAAEFAALHGIPESFGSFREMADQGDFDIMYVGTLHPFHREHAQAALEAGKHVLVEKPFVTSLDDALALTELAEKKGLFIAEGLWTRYFPAVEQALHMIRSGFLGEVKQVEADCCIDAAAVGDTSVLFNKELGGGAHFFFSIYTLGYATAVFGTEPEKILATGHVSDGIDFSNVVVLLYADGKTGIAISGMQVESTEETRILGSKGGSLSAALLTVRRVLPSAESLRAEAMLSMNMNQLIQRIQVSCDEPLTSCVHCVFLVRQRTFQYDLPQNPPTLEETGGFNYPNSIGFQ